MSLQRFSPPWEKSDSAAAISSDVGLIWRGRKPRQARCALPKLGAPLKIARKGRAWLIQVPSFARGQTVVLEAAR